MEDWETEQYSREGYGRHARPDRRTQGQRGQQARPAQQGQQARRQARPVQQSQQGNRRQPTRGQQPRQQRPREQQHRQQQPHRQPPRRRRSKVPFIVAAIAVVAIVIGIGFAFANGQNKAETTVADNTPTAEAVNEAEGQAASQPQAGGDDASSATAPQSGTGGQALANDLAWRDADFAVDPSKPCGSDKDNGRKVVYLTIDDGPSDLTAQVLDILDQYNCKATFFVTGQNPDYFPMIAEAYKRGHTIGLHTYSHDYAEVYSSVDAYFADLDRIGEAVKQQIGYVPCFIRFPGGAANTISANYSTGIMSELVNEVIARGYQYYDWDASCGDGSEHTADELVMYASEAEPETNIVFLCHDGAGKETTVEALPRMIEHFQGQGYTFEAIDRTTWTPHHHPGN